MQELKQTTDRYAVQMDNTFAEIEAITEKPQKMMFKEIGFKSIERSFIDPFSWSENDPNLILNIDHQAASMEAILQSFQSPGWEWYAGVSFLGCVC